MSSEQKLTTRIAWAGVAAQVVFEIVEFLAGITLLAAVLGRAASIASI